MKFEINTEVFTKAVKPVAIIATKKVMTDFKGKNFLSLEASPNSLLLTSYGGTSSITYKITKSDGYDPNGSGGITVLALELQSALRSFHLEDDLLVSIDGDQLRLAPRAEEETYISIPIMGKKVINCPNIPKKNDQLTVVDRNLFVKGLQKVAFAPAYEKTMFGYMCVLFESWKNRFRFSSGTGGRFAVVEFEGKKISTDESRLIFPSLNVSNIISVLKSSDQPTIKIRSVGVSYIHRSPEQIVVETDSITLAIYGLEHFSKYPDLNRMIDYEYPYQIPTRIKDWNYVTEAIAASRHFFGDDIHNTRITADLLHGHFDIQTKTIMRMNRRIDFELGVFVTDSNKDKHHKPWFCCGSEWLVEMVKKGNKDEIVIINFKDQSDTENISDEKQAQKKMKPILIKYPSKIDKDGVSERFFMIFSASTK